MSGTNDTVTVLRAHDGRRLAKTFSTATNGVVIRRDYEGAKWFSAESVMVAGIHDLHALLCHIEPDASACVIRGSPVDGANLSRLRRKKVGPGAPLMEIPRRWLMLDVDGIPLPAGISVIADPSDAGRTLLDLLAAAAPELEGVSAVVQFSSSAGLDELAEAEVTARLPPRWCGVIKRGVTAHVWFWLGTPVGELELKRWMTKLATAGIRLDPCTNRTVQPHYTAAPIFKAPLRDPLAGRRTLLIEGWHTVATLLIPDEPSGRNHAYDIGNRAGNGRQSYQAHLTAIGGPDGFRAPMLRAVCAFLEDNGTEADLTTLKSDLRACIAATDRGPRPAATIALYQSDAHLDAMIGWARTVKLNEQAALQAELKQEVTPTFPDIAVALVEAQRLAATALASFARAIRTGEAPVLLLRLTVGAGKSAAAIMALPDLLSAARATKRSGAAIYYFVPRHDLGDELLVRISDAHPGLKVAIWRGMDQPDRNAPPDDPKRTMCADRELSAAAMAAGQSATAGCKACKWFPAKKRGTPREEVCGYLAQLNERPDVWLMPHNFMFQQKPPGLPEAAVVVIDESFVGASLGGMDARHPVQLAVSALLDDRTGEVNGIDRQRLLYLRRRAHDAIAQHDEDGGLRRAAFLNTDFVVQASEGPHTADEWLALEWATKPKVNIEDGMTREDALTIFANAAEHGFTKLRPMLAEKVRDLLKGPDARSVNLHLVRNASLGRNQGTGDVVRFEWRDDFAEWIASAPKLFLDATNQVELLRCFVPTLETVEIEVKAPGQLVRQIIGAEFGRSRFTMNQNNVRRLGDLIMMELVATNGDVLVIAQSAVEDLLRLDLERRLGALPSRLTLAHHGNITGIDRWGDVARLIVVGRPATNRMQGERLAEVLRGGSVEIVPDGDAAHWPTVSAGIRLADATGRAVRQPRHPDPLTEAVRWSITEGAVMQAIGRCRGVRRDVANPVVVTLLCELALPLTVAEVLTWNDAQPGRIAVAVAEAALTGRALLLAPADLCRARPDLFVSEAAAAHVLRREKGGQTLIIDIYKRLAPLSGLTLARYRKAGGRGSPASAFVPQNGGQAALEAIIGPLDRFETGITALEPMATTEPGAAEISFEREGRVRTGIIRITTTCPGTAPERSGVRPSTPSASFAPTRKFSSANDSTDEAIHASPLKRNGERAADHPDANHRPHSAPGEPRWRARL